VAERKSTRRWFTIAVTTGIAVPLMSVANAGASSSSEHLLSVFGDDLAAVASEVEAAGGEVVETFDVADALLVRLPAGTQAPSGAVVVPDSEFEFQGVPAEAVAVPENTYRDTIGATDADNGAGVTVALVDTGVDHDVAAAGELNVVEHIDASGTDNADDGDGLGHGTFLAGLISGTGKASGGAYQGVAPGANVLDVRVADSTGGTSMTQVLRGLQEVSDAKDRHNVKVVNLALNTGSPLPPWVDPLTRGLETLWAEGITVVVASGNDGPDTISSPASDPTLIATGAVAENKTASRADDELAEFSSYGKAFGEMRPDVSAPGVSLVSLRAPGSLADQGNEQARVPAGDNAATYFKGTGTSMSAAVASGAAAALVADRPALGPDEVKRLFVGTAYEGQLSAGAGAGGLDLAAALATDVSATPQLPGKPGKSKFGPLESDADAWAAFSAGWEAGDLRAVVDAWTQLDPQTRKWAATSWSLAVLGRSLTMPQGDFEGRRWGGRRWGSETWNGRRWGSDQWVGRRWGSIDWGAAEWAPTTWNKIEWEGRRWGNQDWLAFAWTARNISADPEIGDQWIVSGDEWDGRRWGGENWEGRRWGSTDWAGRRWGSEAWAGRRWADFVYSGRRWGGAEWEGRRWGSDKWEGRRWGSDKWEGRRWGSDKWEGRRWGSDKWEGRRWGNTDWAGRRWGNQDWSGRRWGSDEWEGRRWGSVNWTAGHWSGSQWDAMSEDARTWANEDWSGRRWG